MSCEFCGNKSGRVDDRGNCISCGGPVDHMDAIRLSMTGIMSKQEARERFLNVDYSVPGGIVKLGKNEDITIAYSSTDQIPDLNIAVRRQIGRQLFDSFRDSYNNEIIRQINKIADD